MANTIKLKRSSTTGDTPTTGQMELGEIAVNTFDGKLFIRGNNGSDFVNEISSITQGGGSNADTLDNLDSSQFLRSDANDTATGNIDFTGDLTKDSNTVWHNGNQPFYIATNTNTVAGVWKASISEVTAYEDGQLIAFYPNKIDGSGSGTTFEINSLGAKTVTRPDYSTSAITTHYDGTNLIFLRYVGDDDYFIVHADYNSTDDYRVRWNSYVTVNNSSGSGVAVYGYQLLMEGADGKFYPVTEGGSTGNTNAVSTAELRVGGTILYYESSTDRNANTTAPWGVLYESIASGNMEYWNNRDSGWATTYRPIYLVATINSNGNFVLDNTSYTSFLTQDLPTSDDNKYYIRIGWMQDNYDDWRLEINHPIYVYKDGMVREWGGYASNSDKLDNQTGSYYLDYNNFSNTPTASEILTDIKTVDGSGSGLDADTVDSLHASSFLRSDAADTATGQIVFNDGNANPIELQRNSQVGIEFNDTSTGSRYLGVNSGTLYYGGNLNHGINNKVWHEGNDGSGSGLDADTVDGLQATAFATAAQGTTADNALPKAGGTMTGDLTIEDSILEVGNKSGDNYLEIQHSESDTAGFTSQFNNMSRFSNLQGTTNQYVVLADTGTGNSNTLFGVSISSDGGSNFSKKLNLTGEGDLYIGTAGTSKVLTTADEGTGNGLDADTLDGIQASAFVQNLSDLGITSTASELNILDVSTQSPTDGQALTYSTANGLEWGSVASDSPFVENDQTITTSYTVASGKNAQGIGPITISNGAIITVSTGSKLVIT